MACSGRGILEGLPLGVIQPEHAPIDERFLGGMNARFEEELRHVLVRKRGCTLQQRLHGRRGAHLDTFGLGFGYGHG